MIVMIILSCNVSFSKQYIIIYNELKSYFYMRPMIDCKYINLTEISTLYNEEMRYDCQWENLQITISSHRMAFNNKQNPYRGHDKMWSNSNKKNNDLFYDKTINDKQI